MDPRELILMFKDLNEGSFALQQHIKGLAPDTFKQVYNKIKMRSQDPAIKERREEDALYEAKHHFLGLFEEINKQYVAQLRTNDKLEAEFQYSEFSLVRSYVREEQQHKKFLLKEVLEVVQGAILKLYIELDSTGKQLTDFFTDFGGNGEADS